MLTALYLIPVLLLPAESMADFSQYAYKGDEHSEEIQNVQKSGTIKTVQKVAKTRNICSGKLMTKEENWINNGFLGELYSSPGCKEVPLRLLIVGHNPSEQAWLKGHYYANPSNRMWHLLRKASIIPENFTAEKDQDCPSCCGVGFTDLMVGIPETKSNLFSDSEVSSYRSSFYSRLIGHVHRAASGAGIDNANAFPKVIAFSGVRQWRALFAEKPVGSSKRKRQLHCEDDNIDKSTKSNTNCTYGIQKELPSDWPVELEQSIVFLLPSSSGAAALTADARESPYLELGRLLSGFPWLKVEEKEKNLGRL